MRNPFTWPAPTGRAVGYRMIGGPLDGHIHPPGGVHVQFGYDIYDFAIVGNRHEVVLIHVGRL